MVSLLQTQVVNHLCGMLSFCLFDKCSRTNKALDVLNYSKSKFDCKFNFEINGIDYFIERVGKKSPKRGTVKVYILPNQ